MLFVFSCEVDSLFIVTSLSTHGDCCLEVEFQITRGFDEFLEFVNIFQFSITIQQECRMIRIGFVMFM